MKRKEKLIVNGTLVDYSVITGKNQRGGARKGAGRPKGETPPKPRLAVRIDAGQLRELEARAKEWGVDLSEATRVVIGEWLELDRLGWTEKVR